MPFSFVDRYRANKGLIGKDTPLPFFSTVRKFTGKTWRQQKPDEAL
jgi:hypothetical protein